MEFPVYVASDCFGEKINVALRYDPRSDALDALFRKAEAAFALFTVHRVDEQPLQPFAFAYVYNDGQCQWDLLEEREQLSPCCQVYVFRYGGKESVDAIPEPINLVLQQVACASRGGSSPSVYRFSPASALRRCSEKWALPLEERGDSNAEVEDVQAPPGAASASPLHEGNDDRRMGGDREEHALQNAQSRRTKRVDTSSVSENQRRAAVPRGSLSGGRSHRFRVQLLSPTQLDPEACRSNSEHAFSNAVNITAASPLTFYNGAYTRSYSSASSPTALANSASLVRGEAAAIPPEWYNPGATATTSGSSTSGDRRHVSLILGAASSARRYTSFSCDDGDRRYSSSLSHSPVSHDITAYSRRASFPEGVLSAPPLPSALTSKRRHLGPPPLHPTSYTRGARLARGSSILQDERRRVEERMLMSMDELRVSLQEEERSYEYTRSLSQHYHS